MDSSRTQDMSALCLTWNLMEYHVFALRCVPITCFGNIMIINLFILPLRGQDTVHPWGKAAPGTTTAATAFIT
jgi:hypothetical protein